MSVEFAQQSELTRIGKQDRQTTSSMQTHPEEVEEEMETSWIGPRHLGSSSIQTHPEQEEEQQEEEEEEEAAAAMQKRGASPWKEEVEGRARLEAEVRELTSEVARLKEERWEAASGAQKVSAGTLLL